MEHGKQREVEQSLSVPGATFNQCFNLTNLLPHDVSIISTKTETCYPCYSIKDSDVIDFIIPASPVYYTILGKTFLYLRLKVVDKDGAAVGATSRVSVGNLIFSSIFKSIEIYLNNVQINQATGNFAYTAFLNRIINSTETDYYTKLVSEGFVLPTLPDPIDPANNMYSKLLEKTNKNKMEFYGVLNHSIFEMKRLLIPNASLRIRLRLNSPKFCLLSPAGTTETPFSNKFVVEEAHLDVSRCVANSKIQHLHESLLSKGSKLHYPFRERQVVAFGEPTGAITHTSECLLKGTPAFAMVGLLDSTAYFGNEAKDCFGFFHNDLVACHLLINGEKVGNPNFKFSVSDGSYIKLYRSLFNITNTENQSMIINENSFTKNGLFLIPVYSTDDSFKQDRSSVSVESDIKVSLEFKSATSKDLVCILYYTYDRVLSIDRSNVYLE